MSSSSPAIDRPDCVPQISVAGVTNPTKATPYGFVYASRCDQVVRELRFRVTAVGADGKVLSEVPEATATGGVLFPGAELGVAGELDPPAGTKIAGVKVEVTHLVTQSPADFSAWGQAEVVDLARGKPDSLGTFEITGRLRAQPTSAPLCVTEFVLIGRDGSGNVIYGQARATADAGDPVTFSVPPLSGLDFARTKVYAPQVPGTQAPPSAGVTCDGRRLS